LDSPHGLPESPRPVCPGFGGRILAQGFEKANPEGGIIINIYELIRSSVTLRQAAEAYGMTVTRSGMTRCPFHADRNPSMKLYDTAYHCFGCQAHGDVTALTAQIHGTGMREAAERLAADFGIPVTASAYSAADCMERMKRESVFERERRETELEKTANVPLILL
jgi:DNA primase